MYLQHLDPEVVVPQHISRIGVVTAHCFLANSFVAYKYQLYDTTALLIGLYTTSVLHWRKMKPNGLIRTIDILMVISSITKVSLVDSKIFGEKRWAWFYSITAGLISYLANEKLFYKQVLEYSNQIIEYPKKTKHWFFSLYYTNPNTPERELAYYRSVLTHCFFQHILPNAAAIYAILP
jgi:hypothetical protein